MGDLDFLLFDLLISFGLHTPKSEIQIKLLITDTKPYQKCWLDKAKKPDQDMSSSYELKSMVVKEMLLVLSL